MNTIEDALKIYKMALLDFLNDKKETEDDIRRAFDRADRYGRDAQDITDRYNEELKRLNKRSEELRIMESLLGLSRSEIEALKK